MKSGPAAFAGFPPAAFDFLRQLRDNNDPVWFKPRKAVYDAEVAAPLRALLAAVGTAAAAAGMPLLGDPRRGVFRIYRDVRFSPDKRPYKTHAAAVLSRTGGRGDAGVLYIHFEPGASRLGAGFWHPPPEQLARLRRAVLEAPETFLALAAELAAAGYPLSSDERLSRPPRGFEGARGSAVADYVGWKSFTAHAELDDREMASPALLERVLGFAHAVLPLLEWGWEAIDEGPAYAMPVARPARPLPKPDF